MIKFSGLIGYYDAYNTRWYKLTSMEVSEDGYIVDIVSSPCEDDECRFDEYLLPGFIDAHCHLLETPYYSESSCDIEHVSEDDLMKRALCNADVARNSGITTIKDFGGRGYLSLKIKNILTEFSPRIFTSGCYFTSRNGHAHDRGAIIITEADKFSQHLNNLKDNEVKFVKILHGDEGFDFALLRAMIEMAHTKGMFVSCHAYTNKAAMEAALAGTDTLEHAGDYDDKLLDIIEKKGIIVVPTFASAVDSNQENCVGLTDVNNNVLSAWLEGEKIVIPKMISRGIPIALGSDAGFYCFPMDYLLREIELLHDVFGLSAKDVLYSAFITTPKCLCMDDKLGRIAPNYYADYLVYNENPLLNLSLLRNPTQVWIGGKKKSDINIDLLQIQRLSECDVADIMVFLTHNYFNCGKLDDQWSEDELNKWLLTDNDCCVGAFLHNELVGFCLSHIHAEVHKVHLENIFVKEEYRHRGIARKMLDKTINFYSSKKSKVRFVGLVDHGNTPSIHLLKSYGFTVGSTMFWIQKNENSND